MLYLGIDVGKRHHEVALLDDAGALAWRRRLGAGRDGLASLAERLAGVDAAAPTVALEATGVYWLALHAWLTERGAGRIVVLNPLQTRAFRNANLRGSKTDRIDAVALARLGHAAGVRWMGASLSGHVPPEARQAAARDVGRPRRSSSNCAPGSSSSSARSWAAPSRRSAPPSASSGARAPWRCSPAGRRRRR